MSSSDVLKQKVNLAIDRHCDELIELGNWFWENPEPGYREFKTSEKAISFLRKIGLSVTDHLSYTGFRADLNTGNPGPVIALLGELDSLILPSHPQCDPKNGAVHACGHNCHITALLGCALGMMESGVSHDLSGTIAFIGTPAEECIEFDYRQQLLDQGKISAMGGKASMMREGVFDDVGLAFMNHAGGYYGSADHNGMLMKKVTFYGKACHAAHPENGANALSAANLALHAIGLIREQHCDDRSARIHGIISSGGDSVNIIPDRISLEYMIRSSTIPALTRLHHHFDQAMKGCADAMGCTVEIITRSGYMPLENDSGLRKLFEKAVSRIHPNLTVPENSFSGGSTDLGDLGMMIPVFHGNTAGLAGTGHGTDLRVSDPMEAYINSAKVAAFMLIDLLSGHAEQANAILSNQKKRLSLKDYLAVTNAFEGKGNER